VTYPSIGVRKNILLGVEKVKMSLQSPKTEFGAQNQYGRVIYPSIGNITWIMKKYTFGGQKGQNRPLKPKNRNWGLKSVWSCDISIDREYYMDHEKIYFWGSKRPKQAPKAQKQKLGPKISMVV
jgi:hypothetical protein